MRIDNYKKLATFLKKYSDKNNKVNPKGDLTINNGSKQNNYNQEQKEKSSFQQILEEKLDNVKKK